ncbi:hypothetical protein TWF173_010754 [Orbilia oligospora]|nr:hypothetical protein TWF173_010754 [Orbilia oligospora]
MDSQRPRLITDDPRWLTRGPFPWLTWAVVFYVVIVAISVAPAVGHDLANAGAMLVEFFNEICYVYVAPAHWAPDADLHPDASLFFWYALVAAFVTGQGLLREEAEELDFEDASVVTPEAEKESEPAKLPSRPAPASREVIRAFRKQMKEASKRKAERLQARSVRKRSGPTNEGPVELRDEEVEPEAPSVPLAPAPRYVDAGVQTDDTVGAAPEPVFVTEPEPVIEQLATDFEAEPLAVADLTLSASVVEEVEDSDAEDVSVEGSEGSSSLDQLWEGPSGLSEDGESEEEESAILEEADSQGMEENEERESASSEEAERQGDDWSERESAISGEAERQGMEEEQVKAPGAKREIKKMPRGRVGRLDGSQWAQLRAEQERERVRMEQAREERVRAREELMEMEERVREEREWRERKERETAMPGEAEQEEEEEEEEEEVIEEEEEEVIEEEEEEVVVEEEEEGEEEEEEVEDEEYEEEEEEDMPPVEEEPAEVTPVAGRKILIPRSRRAGV